MAASRQQWHPISTTIAHGKTGSALLARFGPNGLLAWILLLLAARRSRTRGVLVYVSEDDAWRDLGLLGYERGFTLDEFLTRTGELKQTSRRRIGALLEIRITNYEAWENMTRRQREAERKASKRAENKADTSWTDDGTNSGHYADALRPDPDPDPDQDLNPSSQPVLHYAANEPADAPEPDRDNRLAGGVENWTDLEPLAPTIADQLARLQALADTQPEEQPA